MMSGEWPLWDEQLFRLIHNDGSLALLDGIMPVYRDKRTWLPLYALLLFGLWRGYQRKGLLVALGAGVSVGLADGISSSLIKPAVGRLRPCRTESLQAFIRDIIDCGPGLSFPSSHAANHMALSVFLFVLFYRRFPKAAVLGLCWGLSIGYAQVYVGLHFPLDVLAGSALGTLIGWSVARLFLWGQPNWRA